MFLHGGWFHLTGNLLVQLRVGVMLEATRVVPCRTVASHAARYRTLYAHDRGDVPLAVLGATRQ